MLSPESFDSVIAFQVPNTELNYEDSNFQNQELSNKITLKVIQTKLQTISSSLIMKTLLSFKRNITVFHKNVD